jgi:hypothetical protein
VTVLTLDALVGRSECEQRARDSIDVGRRAKCEVRNEANAVTCRTRTMALDSSPKPEASDGVCWK